MSAVGEAMGWGRVDRGGSNQDWKARWSDAEAARQHRGRYNPPVDTPDFFGQALKKYGGLRKHERPLLMQILTETIGLNAFLFNCKVPQVMLPLCCRGHAREIAEGRVAEI